ncbi:acyl-CoA thioesterase [bacterium]|nr:acyl-CoA thioesterase [bacterium]MBP9807299.1 acyl-CoA thioesterase [bacterium]
MKPALSKEALLDRKCYKHWTKVNLRYGDTDKLGHVNNAVFITLFESGRAALLFNREGSLAGPGKTMVLANIDVDFKAELHYPGDVEVGTALVNIGRSSLKLAQVVYKDGVCCAVSQSTIVLIDEKSRKPIPFPFDLARQIEQTAPLTLQSVN